MNRTTGDFPRTLGELHASDFTEEKLAARSVKDEMRENLICRLQQRETLFPGIVGYEETVVPQMVNALLSRHNFILLGLRGQAKTRLIRMLTTLLDEYIPYIDGCEIHDNPYHPICRRCRDLVQEAGGGTPVNWLHRDHRYVEKLATPDVTIADMIGDIDPIKAARRGHDISDELTVHYGLLPRANRGIFAINELPDLAGKIQVGLFNIMQEGDVQIKGYPVRLPLDIMLVFTANPEDYTARGKIITPLKDRIGSEIRTHYPVEIEQGLEITRREAWLDRRSPVEVRIPEFIREVVEQIAFLSREDKRVDNRSGVSQRLPITVLENVVSNAERRALAAREKVAVPRILDIYAALPSITGKLELEYEGEMKGGDAVAREIIRSALGKVYDRRMEGVNVSPVVQWFDLGGSLKLDESGDSAFMLNALSGIQGLMDRTRPLKVGADDPPALRAAAAEFILEGLYAHRRISRSEERGFVAEERRREPVREETPRGGSPRRQFN
ncbi:MAG: magnesium chelatase [Bryobacteraceae bacterium]